MSRVRLLVGCERAELEAEGDLHPFIAGAVNESVWHDDPDKADMALRDMKRDFDPAGECDWRETWGVFDDEPLASLFRHTPIVGAILDPDDDPLASRKAPQ